jgi:acetolactate synthase I/II/III large subunit
MYQTVQTTLSDVTVAEAYLHILADRGIDYFFANAGTDFAPLIEAFAKGAALGQKLPLPITVPHENVAVHMAMGHALVSGKPQAVMVHVNVGTANALTGLLNARRGRVPMLFTAGRTPILEEGMRGARSVFVHWAQEMYDQAGMVREAVKWDYELRLPEQLETVVDRALSLAGTAPSGPVYLTLPREVLARRLETFSFTPGGPHQPASLPAAASEGAVAEAADAIARARNPLILTTNVDRMGGGAAVAALARLAGEQAIPVVSYNPSGVELPASHPMHMGYDVKAWLEEADLVLVVEALVPWLPRETHPKPGATVIHLGIDPLYEDIPIRGFPCDLAIAASTEIALTQIADRLATMPGNDAALVERRRAGLAERRAQILANREAVWIAARKSADITPIHISRAIDAIKGDALVLKESGLRLDQMDFEKPGTMFFAGTAGGLGWSLGAALGAKLAAPDREVISTVGDGSYMFGTPLAAHYVAAEQKLPVLFVVFNNGGWHAVRRSTRGMFKDGFASATPKGQVEPLTDFGFDIKFEKMMETVDGHGERVEHPDDLPKALARAQDIVRTEKRQVLLNIVSTT